MAANKESSKPKIVEVAEVKTDLRKKEPPLVDVKIANPVTYIKSWWRKVIGNEGIDFRFKVRPLTAIAISIIIITVSAGIGRFVLPFKIPFFEFTSEPTPTPSPNPWRDTAFSGILRYTEATGRYYLETASSEAITLQAPENIDLSSLPGKRIFATGSYNPDIRTLKVAQAKDLEILPEEIEPIPLVSPSPSPSKEASPASSTQPFPSP